MLMKHEPLMFSNDINNGHELITKIWKVEEKEIAKAAERAATKMVNELRQQSKPRSYQQKLEEKTRRETRALTVKELRQKEMLKEVGQTSPGVVTLGEELQDYGDENRSAYEIIREWNEPTED
jgi:hypothetical protein